MKFAADEEHRKFFLRNQSIEFEEVFSKEESSLIKGEVQRLLSSRAKKRGKQLQQQKEGALFELGRDLWRDSGSLKKLILHRKLAELVHQLTEKRTLRIGFDQYFPSVDKTAFPSKNAYTELLEHPFSLNDFCPLKGVACGVLVALEEGGEEKEGIFPIEKGNAVFLHPDASLNWAPLLQGRERSYYLVVFASGTSLFVLNRKDPLAGFLLHQGYSSGDKLKDEKNPIVYRK